MLYRLFRDETRRYQNFRNINLSTKVTQLQITRCGRGPQSMVNIDFLTDLFSRIMLYFACCNAIESKVRIRRVRRRFVDDARAEDLVSICDGAGYHLLHTDSFLFSLAIKIIAWVHAKKNIYIYRTCVLHESYFTLALQPCRLHE